MIENLDEINGIDLETGDFLDGPKTDADFASVARGEPLDTEQSERAKQHLAATSSEHLGTVPGIDARELSQTGWGVIFSSDEDQAVIDALRILLDWRQSKAGPLYKEFKKETGYTPKMTKAEFLKDADGFGPVNPKHGVPYYLMIVGSPEKIPFRFQYQVDVQYAVGRIHFDTIDEYRMYAESVVAAEKGNLTLPKEAAFFGVANPGDTATLGSSQQLIQPLRDFTLGLEQGWNVNCPPPEETTRAKLIEIVNNAPALVITASHGLGVSMDHPKHFTHTGALLCQGPKGPLSNDVIFAAKDVPDEARLHGSIFMLFACYGAGMPSHEEFFDADLKRKQKAKQPFVSALPKRLLAHKGGGALAVIGHVERAWPSSFKGKRSKGQLQTFSSTWQNLLEGYPVGYAMEHFNIRFAELSSMLSDALQDDLGTEKQFRDPSSPLLANLWKASNDARNYCVIGDPAVRLRVSATPSGPVAIQREAASVLKTVKEEKAVGEDPMAESFAIQSLFGSSEPEPSGLANVLEKMVGRIGATMEKVVEGLTTVEVATYTSDNLDNVEFKDGQFTGAKLRARTRLGMDGKTVNLVPERDGKVEEDLWAVHMASVDKAVLNRSEMIKLAANAASSLLAVMKK